MNGKKKLVQINTVCNTSTGRIMGAIQREAVSRGYEAVSYVGRRKPFADMACVKFGNPLSFWLHVALTTFLDRQGYGSFFAHKEADSGASEREAGYYSSSIIFTVII